MRIRTMIRLDEWLGIPLSYLAACLAVPARLAGLRRRRAPAAPRRILVTKYFGLGSLVLALPMLRALRRRHPGASIHLLTFASNGSLAARMAPVDHVHVVRTGRLGLFVLDTLRILVILRRLRFDACLDLEFFSRYSALVPLAGGVRWRVGFGPRPWWCGGILDAAVAFDRGRHLTASYLDLAACLGCVEPRRAPARPARGALIVAPEDSRRIDRVLESRRVPPRAPLLVVNPNASALCLERRWPRESFAGLIERLVPRLPGHRIVLVGTAGERDHVRALLGDLSPAARSHTADLCGDLDMGGLLALLSRARGAITNDSGPMHLAAALGTPVVALFGPESPALYGPLGPGGMRGGGGGPRRAAGGAVFSRAASGVVFYRPVPCSPCLNVYRGKISPCGGHNICMWGIGVDEVAAATVAMLRRVSSLEPSPRLALSPSVSPLPSPLPSPVFPSRRWVSPPSVPAPEIPE